jgi:hypothetical protein
LGVGAPPVAVHKGAGEGWVRGGGGVYRRCGAYPPTPKPSCSQNTPALARSPPLLETLFGGLRTITTSYPTFPYLFPWLPSHSSTTTRGDNQKKRPCQMQSSKVTRSNFGETHPAATYPRGVLTLLNKFPAPHPPPTPPHTPFLDLNKKLFCDGFYTPPGNHWLCGPICLLNNARHSRLTTAALATIQVRRYTNYLIDENLVLAK